MRTPRPHHVTSLLLLVLALVTAATGCGEPAADRGAGQEPTAPPTAEPVTTLPEAEPEEAPRPTPSAIAAGKRYERLVAAYTPVSVRINFLVAAETLRQDAVDSGAGEDVERERFGAVRVEVVRMREVLRRAAPRVARSPVGDADEQHVQQLMLTAIRARLRALAQLERALDALASDRVPDSRAQALVDLWRSTWDVSLRAAREATTSMQDARARLGLEPALEESIR